MSSTQEPTRQEEGDATAKALEEAYKESHPNGPYPPVEIKSKPEKSQQPAEATTELPVQVIDKEPKTKSTPSP